ncbi:response regulator, partial [Rickettsiales bacterium]|nr:response regulator [Rickettsiales bacterium]
RTLELATNNINRDINDIYSRRNKLNSFIGKDIAQLPNIYNKNNKILTILENYHDRTDDILPWPGIAWMDDEGYQTVTYQIGVRKPKLDMSKRKYLPYLSKEPWVLHTSTPDYGSTSNEWIIPVATGITDNDNKYIGAVIVAFDISRLLKELQKNTPKNVQFIIIDKNNNLIVNNHHTREILQKVNIDYNQAIKEQKLSIEIENIKYLKSKAIKNYDYVILAGYEKSFLHNQVKVLITEKISEVLIITIFFTFILSLLKIKNNIREKENIATIAESLAASIAHEMRNPISSIRLAINNLPLNSKELTNSKLTDFKKQIKKTIDLAGNVIDMTLHELAGKKFTKEDFSYYKSYQAIIDALDIYGYKNNEEKKKLIIDFNGIKITGDKIDIDKALFDKINNDNNFIINIENTAFKYVIFNLLKNALFYLKDYPKSNVTISFEKEQELNPKLAKKFNIKTANSGRKIYNVINITDTGPGIKEDIITKIFYPYFTAGKKKGTGMGLNFCQRVMTSFGGGIICESKLGECTKFSLLFPILNQEEKKLAQKEITEYEKKLLDAKEQNIDLDEIQNSFQKQKGKNILLIDDVRTNIEILAKEIKDKCQNINIEIITNPLESIKLIDRKEKSNQQFDLILTDIEMPEMDGVKLISYIRNKLSISKDQLPILAYSSRDDIKTINQAKKAGCNAYYTKPKDFRFIARNISKWILNNYIPNKNVQNEMIIINDKTLQGCNVIIADDQLMNLTLIAKTFEKYGANVTKCNDGEDIIKLIEDNILKYDLIITDINMERIGGVEATQAIRKIEESHNKQNKLNHKIPIIALSGDSDRKFVMNILNNDIDDYMVKGRNFDNLIKLSRFWIDYRKTSHSNNISNNKIIDLNKEDATPQDSNKTIIKDDFLSLFSNKEDANEIINLFHIESQNIIKEIIDHRSDITKLQKSIHKLKGSTGSIGSIKLYNYLSSINQTLKDGKLPTDNNLSKKIEDMIL